jgi:hypothetical protein
MKSFVRVLSIIFIGLCFYFQNTPVQAEVIDKIVAILDEDLILLSEIQEGTRKPVVKVIANLDTSGNIEQDALQYIIERHLLLREVQYLAFPKEKELVKSLAIQYIINTYYNQDAKTFAEKVQAQRITEAEIEQELTLYMKGVDYIRRKNRFSADIDEPNVVLNLFQKWVEDLQAQVKIQTSF